MRSAQIDDEWVISSRSSRIVFLPLTGASFVWAWMSAPDWYIPVGILLTLAVLLSISVRAEVRASKGEILFGWVVIGLKRLIYRRIRPGEFASIEVEEAEGVEGGSCFQVMIRTNGRKPIPAGAWVRKSDAVKASERIRGSLGLFK